MKHKNIGTVLSRHRKSVLIAFDVVVEVISYILPWMLIQGRVDLAIYYPLMISSCLFFVCCYEIMYWVFGMYDSLWRYAEVVEFFRLVVASVTAVLVFVVGSLLIFQDRRVPLAIYFLSALFATAVTLYSRLTYRMYRNMKLRQPGRKRRRRVMVIGAGEACATLLHEQNKDPDSDMSIICIVDDDRSKVGRSSYGVQIMGTTEDIPELVKDTEIDTIILAIPSITDEERRRILDICAQTKCNLRILPDMRQMMIEGGDLTSRIRQVRVEDLLGRAAVEFSNLSSSLLEGRVVMVTGGGGSIGSELCRQIARYRPKLLVVVDIYENNAYSIQQELKREYGDALRMEVMIASVRDEEKIDALFGRFKPEVVFHAAAHKHVPLMEDSPEEAVKNNVFGTLNTAKAADKHGAKRFVLISTDKAVNPTNVMGASKRVCEMVVQGMAQKSKTLFMAVRFGNVLGSNGSVIPLFKEQIEMGGPVTVTHPEIKRYFMTIPEAVSLVLEAGAMGKGGEIFVLDMGQQVKIVELAEKLIQLAGFVPYDEIDIQFIGLRPGEKLYEELMMDEENVDKTGNRKIYICKPLKIDGEAFTHNLDLLKKAAKTNNGETLVNTLETVVPTFHHNPFEGEI